VPRRYRAYGQGQWVGTSGNAAVALYNPLGSNKAIYVHSVEVINATRSASSVATSFATFAVARGASTGGELVSVAEYDSTYTPTTGIGLYRDVSWSATPDLLIPWIQYKRWSPAAAPAIASMFGPNGRIKNARAFLGALNPPRDADLETIVIRAGESAGLYVAAINASQVYKATITFKVVGGGFYSCTQYIRADSEQGGPLVLRNDSASDIVRLISIDVHEIGTFDSPYLQLTSVLLNPASLEDASKRMPVVKFDTADAAFPGFIISDAAVAPANGIPVDYISEASAGAPKGFNYLGTKDFLGPAYRLLFPETAGYGATAGTLGSRNLTGLNNRVSNILGGREADPIIVRPGEAIGLCSAAELATAATAVPVSGWSSFDFAMTMSVQDLVVPTIQLTGLQTGTRVCLVEAGTETLVDIGDESGGTFTYIFDASPGDFVDINILCPGFVFQQIPNVELVASVQTIPVTQAADPIYNGTLSEAVTFDAATKRIVCDAGNTSLNVPATYTEWVDWAMLANNLRFFIAFENQGGTVIDSGAGTFIPAYCYLVNGWRVRPQEANGTLSVTDGILLVDGGGDPFVNTLGSFVVRILFQQPVQAITVSTGGGGGGDWTTTEKEQIRNRLGIDGSASAPSATPTLARPGDSMDLVADAVDSTALAASAVAEIADGVWDELLAGHTIVGSAGAALAAAGTAGDPWVTPLPGAYAIGTAGYIVGTNLNATVGSRLAAASYTAPDNAGIAAIGATVAANLDVTVSSRLAALSYTVPDNAGIAAIQAKTDQLTFTVANRADVNVRLMNSAAVLGDGTAGNLWRG
jgi:hypothetical protein